MDNSNNQSQIRLVTAVVLSMIVLFGWSYFYTPTKPADSANTAANANVVQTAPAQPTPVPQVPQTAPETPDNIPNRAVTIKSPLYEVTLDSKGALATSWILLKNKLKDFLCLELQQSPFAFHPYHLLLVYPFAHEQIPLVL